MTTEYTIHGQSFTGSAVICYRDGLFIRTDVSNTKMTNVQMRQWLDNVPILEDEFLLRAEKSKAIITIKKIQ